jgi:hypothetical protein
MGIWARERFDRYFRGVGERLRRNGVAMLRTGARIAELDHEIAQAARATQAKGLFHQLLEGKATALARISA